MKSRSEAHIRRAAPELPASSVLLRSAASPGFTIPELLVVIVVIAVLVSLLVPGLGPSRRRARDARNLSLLASHSRSLTQYAIDNRGTWPYFTRPDGVVRVRFGGDMIPLRYFDAVDHWHLALAEGAFGVPSQSDAFSAAPGAHGQATSFVMTATILADPTFWNRTTRVGPSQWRSTRDAEVLFPDRKAAFIVGEEWFPGDTVEEVVRDRRAMMGFFDGSAAIVPNDRVLPAYPNGTGRWAGSWIDFEYPAIVTIDGLRGRDRR